MTARKIAWWLIVAVPFVSSGLAMSLQPTVTPEPTQTQSPTMTPSIQQSFPPTITPLPTSTDNPSLAPSLSLRPSLMPSDFLYEIRRQNETDAVIWMTRVSPMPAATIQMWETATANQIREEAVRELSTAADIETLDIGVQVNGQNVPQEDDLLVLFDVKMAIRSNLKTLNLTRYIEGAFNSDDDRLGYSTRLRLEVANLDDVLLLNLTIKGPTFAPSVSPAPTITGLPTLTDFPTSFPSPGPSEAPSDFATPKVSIVERRVEMTLRSAPPLSQLAIEKWQDVTANQIRREALRQIGPESIDSLELSVFLRQQSVPPFLAETEQELLLVFDVEMFVRGSQTFYDLVGYVSASFDSNDDQLDYIAQLRIVTPSREFDSAVFSQIDLSSSQTRLMASSSSIGVGATVGIVLVGVCVIAASAWYFARRNRIRLEPFDGHTATNSMSTVEL